MDWSVSHTNVVTACQIDPHSMAVLGELSGFEPGGSSLTWGYYTDTRVSGKLKALNPNWREHALLRIVHAVPEWNYSNTLATMVVTEAPWSRAKGGTTVEYELHSALSMIEKDFLPYHYSIASGARSNDVFNKMLEDAGRPHRLLSGCNNYRYGSAKQYERGDSRLSDLFDIADASGNRLDVDGEGRITFAKYVTPKNITPSWSIDLADPRTTVLDGVSGGTEKYSEPTRVVVTFKGSESENGKTKEYDMAAYADRKSGETSAVRGYTLAKVESISDLNPKTQAALQAEADKRIPDEGGREWELQMLYAPIRIGQTVSLTFPDGPDEGTHRALVKNVELSLGDMIIKLTLKEV